MRPKAKKTEHEKQLVSAPLSTKETRSAMDTVGKPLDLVYLALIQQVHDTKDHNVLRLAATAKKMGRATSTIWHDVKKGTFPPPIRLGERAVGWLQAEVDAILAARTLSSRAAKPLDIKLFISILTGPRLPPKERANTVAGFQNA